VTGKVVIPVYFSRSRFVYGWSWRDIVDFVLGMLGSAYVGRQEGNISRLIFCGLVWSSRNQMNFMVFIDALLPCFCIGQSCYRRFNLTCTSPYILGQKSAALQIPLAYVYALFV